MADQRIPLRIKDDEGAVHAGEVLVVSAYTAELQLAPNAAFSIVLSLKPVAPEDRGRLPRTAVVCSPQSRVRLPSLVSETRESYSDGGADGDPQPLQLPLPASASFAAGTLLASVALETTAKGLFAADGATPFDALARELVAAAVIAGRCWAALAAALAQPNPPPERISQEQIRNKLSALLRRPAADDVVAQAAARLQRVVDGEEPADCASSPAELADDVACVRYFDERPEQARALAAMRDYIDRVAFGGEEGELGNDFHYTREQLSYVAIIQRPHEIARIGAMFEALRTRYTAAYDTRHATYWREVAGLASDIAAAAPAARALARLNDLPALGRPLGREALQAYVRLAAAPSDCPQTELAAALQSQPVCPQCGVAIGRETPANAVANTLATLDDALARQQTRLASEAVRRILARGGQRLEQFIQIVQASDLTSFVRVLDGDVLVFLQELLSEPVTPTPEALDLFEELARSHPVISEEHVEAVTRTLRELITARLAALKEDDPEALAAFRLAAFPPPS